MKLLTIFLLASPAILLFGLGIWSKQGKAPGLVDDKLAPCPSAPNCVCSEYPDDTNHYLPPLTVGKSFDLNQVALAIEAQGGKVVVQDNRYLAAAFTSAVFSFVDDVEFRLDLEKGQLHRRSASRVGYSDLGVNKKRLISLEKSLNI